MDFWERVASSWLGPAGISITVTALVGGIIWGLQHNNWISAIFKRLGALEGKTEVYDTILEEISTNNIRTALILEQIQKEITRSADTLERHLREVERLKEKIVRLEAEAEYAKK